MDLNDNNKAWDFAIGIVQLDGIKPSEEFMELVEKEKRGEISSDDIRDILVKKYTIKEEKKMNIHENIKKARKVAGITQKDLAEAIGVYQKDISRWENGERTPSVEALAVICKTLKVSANVLLETGIKDE